MFPFVDTRHIHTYDPRILWQAGEERYLDVIAFVEDILFFELITREKTHFPKHI